MSVEPFYTKEQTNKHCKANPCLSLFDNKPYKLPESRAQKLLRVPGLWPNRSQELVPPPPSLKHQLI